MGLTCSPYRCGLPQHHVVTTVLLYTTQHPADL